MVDIPPLAFYFSSSSRAKPLRSTRISSSTDQGICLNLRVWCSDGDGGDVLGPSPTPSDHEGCEMLFFNAAVPTEVQAIKVTVFIYLFFIKMAMLPARHNYNACFLLRAEFLAFQSVVDITHSVSSRWYGHFRKSSGARNSLGTSL